MWNPKHALSEVFFLWCLRSFEFVLLHSWVRELQAQVFLLLDTTKIHLFLNGGFWQHPQDAAVPCAWWSVGWSWQSGFPWAQPSSDVSRWHSATLPAAPGLRGTEEPKPAAPLAAFAWGTEERRGRHGHTKRGRWRGGGRRDVIGILLVSREVFLYLFSTVWNWL